MAVPLLLLLLFFCDGCHADVPPALRPAPLIGTTDQFYDVQAIDRDRAVVIGYGGKILVTADGGRHWRQPPSGTDRALYSVHFVDDQHGWIAGEAGTLLATSDGGASWQPQRGGTFGNLFALTFVDRLRGWAVGEHSTLLSTSDGGTHWRPSRLTSVEHLSPQEAITSAEPMLYDVDFVSPSSGWVVGEFGKILHTSDGGATWVAQEASLLGRDVVGVLALPTFFGVNFIDERRGVATGTDGRVVRTDDGGENWVFDRVRADSPILDPLFSPVLLADGSGWSVGAAGDVLRRAHPDDTWRRHAADVRAPSWLRGMDWADATYGWIVGGSGTILRTTDGGNAWTAASA